MKRNPRGLAALSLGLIGLTAGFLAWQKSHQTLAEPGVRLREVDGVLEAALPERVAGYAYTRVPPSEIERAVLPSDTTFGKARYMRGLERVDAHVVLMGADRTSIHKPDFCLTGQGWRIEQRDEVALSIAGAEPYELSATRLINSGEFLLDDGKLSEVRAVLMYWFVSGDATTPRSRDWMWSLSKRLLTTGTLERWAYVTFVTYCYPGQEEAADRRLRRFIAEAVPQFQLVDGPSGAP